MPTQGEARVNERAESQVLHGEKTTGDRPKRQPLLSSELDPIDPATQEDRAFLDLFRSVNVGEMIAVVGSGVTVPYGYMSWSGFCTALINHLQHAEDKKWLEDTGRALFEQFRSDTEKLSKLNSEEQRAICGALQAHLNAEGREALKSKYREWFGRRKRLKFTNGDMNVIFPNANAKDHPPCIKPGEYLPQDLGRLVELCAKVAGGALAHHCWIEPKSPQALISAPRNIIDPLTTLRSAVRISRFATLNYDLEIESMLEDHDYPYNTLTEPNQAESGTGSPAGTRAGAKPQNLQKMPQLRPGNSAKDTAVRKSDSRTGSSARSISLSVDNASELIGVAAGSRSEDAVVVHLHGAATNPEDMVVTPSDYNALYIHDYPEHASFDDARMLMFGGNAILYVGVGLSEEDLMRPLRYLASALPDRPIYALMPSMKSRAKDRAFVHNVKASYGVNAIIYGRADDDIPALWTPWKVRHALGRKFNALHDELENVRKGLTALFTDPSIAFDAAINPELTPRLCHHPQFNEVLRCMHVSIKSRVKARSDHFNACVGRQYIEILSSLGAAAEDTTLSGLPETTFLQDERKTIDAAIATHGNDAHGLHRSLTEKTAPRLHRHPAYKAARKLLDSPADELDEKERDLIQFVESLVTSIALDQILSYLPESAAQAQRRWEIAAAHNATERSRKSAASLIALNAAPREHDDGVVHDTPIALAAMDALLKILQQQDQKAFIIQSPHGTSRADFLEQAMRLREKTPGSTETTYDVRSYRINNLVDANMVLPGILHALSGKNNTLAIIYDAIHLLDPEMRHTRNLSIEHHLRNLIANDVRLLLLTHSRSATHTLSKTFGIKRIDYAPPIQTPAIATGIMNAFDEDSEGSWALKALIPRYIWPNKALTAVIGTLPGPSGDDRAFLATCNRLLESRLRASDRQFSIPIFCDVLLQSRHVWVRRYGTGDERLRLVIEHAILKWMFAIHFPIGIGTVQRLVEIQGIKTSYGMGCGKRCGHACPECTRFNAHLEDALSDLERCGFIVAVENRHDHKLKHPHLIHEKRYILDSNVYRHLAHTRDLTHDATDRLEWSIATLCNAVFCRGPLLSDNDYRSTRGQFKAFVEDYYCDFTLPDKNGDLPSEAARHENYTLLNGLNCAFALLRGHLHAHNAIRAGIAYYKESDHRSVLDAHIGRLSQLRSTTLSVPLGQIPYHEYFEVWVVNEIAVAKYIKGDFHDAVMMLRQILFALRSANRSGSVSTDAIIASDPTIKPRIKINLCMCLIERAKFKDALALLDEADHEISEIACAASHPEGELQKARVSILLMRARILLQLEQVDSARTLVLDAISLSMLNGMRLKRISGLVLMAAVMAMRGEHKAARSFLVTVKLKATQMRYIRAVLDIDRLDRAMEIEGGVAKWAGYLSESDVSPLHTPHT